MDSYLTSDLPPGSLVIERYVYKTQNNRDGVQWLAQIVSSEGFLLLVEACKTRGAALEVVGGQ